MGAVAGGIASGRVPAGRQGRRPGGQLDQPDLDRRPACWRSPWPRTWPPSTSCGTRGAPASRPGRVLPAARGGRGRRGRGVVALSGWSSCTPRRPYVFDGLTSRALPVVIARRRLRLRCAGPAGPRRRPRRAGARRARGGRPRGRAGASRSGRTCCPRASPSSEAAAPSGTLSALIVAVVLAVVIVLPGFVLLYVLDQRAAAARGRGRRTSATGRRRPRGLSRSTSSAGGDAAPVRADR